MPENFSQILIPLIGVIASVITSVLITSLRNKAELKKIHEELVKNYAQKLFEKRIEIYPELCSLFSDYGKKIQYNSQNMENLKDFRDNFDRWDNKYSIFLTQATIRIAYRFNNYLQTLLEQPPNKIIQPEDWKDLRNILIQFETSLRSEIGIYDTKPAGEFKEIEQVYGFIDEKIKSKGTKSSHN